jgi:hypothetical protein
MDWAMLTRSFTDELQKIASKGNFLGASPYKGTNVMASSSLPRATGMPKPTGSAAKPTNYSIVHNEAPTVAYGTDATVSKVDAPPPPVKT